MNIVILFIKSGKKQIFSIMDETYIKIKGEWYFLYIAIDKDGHRLDFQLRKTRNHQAAYACPLSKGANEKEHSPSKCSLVKFPIILIIRYNLS